VRTAVLESVQFPVDIANQDDRCVTDASCHVVAWVGHLDFESEIMPVRTPKQVELLGEEYVWSLKQPVGDAVVVRMLPPW
jgi:hypothetical protein